MVAMVAEPLLWFLQVTSRFPVMLDDKLTPKELRVSDSIIEQPLTSVTVTVYIPACKPVAAVVVSPVDQMKV